MADGQALDASSVDAIGEIGNEFPLGGSTERWGGGTIGGWTDYLAHWAGNIRHLEKPGDKQKSQECDVFVYQNEPGKEPEQDIFFDQL